MRTFKALLSAVLLVLAAPLAHADPTPPPTTPSAQADATVPPSPVTVYGVRLRPGDDLRPSLMAFAKARGLQAAFVITTVGSVREARLRLANQQSATVFGGPLEIVSLVGTLNGDGAHLHATVSDASGRVYGGHLMDGCPVYTTAEVVLGEASALRFRRALDPATTFPELHIEPR